MRNLALQRATGDFIAFLDADDELEPDFLAALGALAACRPDLDILTTDSRFVVNGRSDGTFYEKNAFPIDDQRMAMLRGCFITTQDGSPEVPIAGGGWFRRSAEAW